MISALVILVIVAAFFGITKALALLSELNIFLNSLGWFKWILFAFFGWLIFMAYPYIMAIIRKFKGG